MPTHNKICIGLGKTLFNSSASIITNQNNVIEIELLLSERLNRQKASGVWPSQALEAISQRYDLSQMLIGENRDVMTPNKVEEALNGGFPFFEMLQRKKLSQFTSHLNKDVHFITHHLCHASAALMMSPFERALILVIDGAGTNIKDFPKNHSELSLLPDNPEEKNLLEESSVYSIENGKLKCLMKNWQEFVQNERVPEHAFSDGLGTLYEKSAEYIFNDKRAAGKVMGLAAFGQPHPISNRTHFLKDLDWSLSFKGKGKVEWENSPHFNIYANIAASVQNHFELSLLSLMTQLKQAYPEYDNLILMGGCALNCTTNMKIFNTGLFKAIYVPPFPGDESIGLGAASYLYHFIQNNKWEPRSWDDQNGYFGSPNHIPTEKDILNEFNEFKIIKPNSIEKFTAQMISENKIIGWYQGRSETGPRALGNRSILARVDTPGLKSHLNSKIKMRENFRPYGCSILHEEADKYFDIPKGFENPFMSFAVSTRKDCSTVMREVTHFDGTSRMQTVKKSQNLRFYNLIKEVGHLTGVPCVLNTSLNVMGEPIVETVADAKRFLQTTAVDALAIGDLYISKKDVNAD